MTGVKSLRLSSNGLSLDASSAGDGTDCDVSNDELAGVNGAGSYAVSPERYRLCGVCGLRPTITVLSFVSLSAEDLLWEDLRDLIRVYRPTSQLGSTLGHENFDFLMLPSQSPSQKCRGNSLEALQMCK